MDDASSSGLIGSLRELADGVVASAQDRLALLAVEFQEEKFRLIQNFIWLGAAFFTGLLALTFVSLAVIACFEGEGRLIALIVFAAAYAGALIAILLGARRHFAREGRPFAATLQELTRDRTCIRPDR